MRFLVAFCLASAITAQAVDELDTILHRTPVPNRLLKQGEVRLLQRDGAVVVQTALRSGHIEKVCEKIVSAEKKNWPDFDPDVSDRIRYSETLLLECDRAKKERKGNVELLIEFSARDQEVSVGFYTPVYETRKGKLVIVGKRLLQQLPLSTRYVRENMELILMDAFSWKPARVRAVLGLLDWTPAPRSQTDGEGV